MTVYLVGAGPGDPGLITVRGAALLRRAEVVVHDRLVDSRVLGLAAPGALLIDVGKRAGSVAMRQEAINALLVEHGRTSEVVRLKGGDPYVFGRGGEEAKVLAAADVAYEVVPGLSSALAAPAAAGIPVTMRGHASAVVIFTAHDPAALEGLAGLARAGATLVAMMAGATRAALAERLIADGVDPATPVAAIESGSLPEQRTQRSTLAGIGDLEVRSPVMLVIGEVASAELSSIEARPLHGWRVVVTRRREQAGELVDLLEERGAAVVSYPTIAIEYLVEAPGEIAAALAELGEGDWVVLASTNAVAALLDALRDARALAGRRIAVVGGETRRALREGGIEADLEPARANSSGLLAAFPEAPAGAQALLVRATAGGPRLQDGLAALGYRVHAVAAYRTTVPDIAGRPLGRADAVLFASPSAVEGFLALAGRDALPPVVVTIGPETSARCREAGFEVSAECATPSAHAMVDALEAIASRRGSTLAPPP